MGCGAGMKENKVDTVAPTSSNGFTVKIKNPNTNEELTFSFKDDYDEVPLTRLMNRLCFASRDKEKLDANFLVFYNDQTDDFDYYIDRLLGVEAGA